MNLVFLQRPLAYVPYLDNRRPEDINLVVVHCTELPDLSMARDYGEKVHYPDTQTGNSGHFYIDRDGSIEQWVPLDRVAHHVRGFNPQSIGIEMVNSGRYPNWFHSSHQVMSERYTDKQIKALVDLLNHLQTTLPNLNNIAGHEDLDTGMIPSEDKPGIMIRRKLDPGLLFPWSELMKQITFQRLVAEDL